MTKHRGTYVPRPIVYTRGLDGPIIAMVTAMSLFSVVAGIIYALQP